VYRFSRLSADDCDPGVIHTWGSLLCSSCRPFGLLTATPRTRDDLRDVSHQENAFVGRLIDPNGKLSAEIVDALSLHRRVRNYAGLLSVIANCVKADFEMKESKPSTICTDLTEFQSSDLELGLLRQGFQVLEELSVFGGRSIRVRFNLLCSCNT
jgi:hypothetical protein